MPDERGERQAHTARDESAGPPGRVGLVGIAEEEARRERHVRVVVARQGDPHFVQRSRNGACTTYEWSTDTPEGRRMLEAVRYQQDAFRAKFGRDPRPDDPLFFDPDADVPVQLSREKALENLSELADRAQEFGWPPAMIKAWQELGYVVTRANMHTFSAAQVQAYEEAVRGHWAAEGQDDDEAGIEEVVAEVAEATLHIVAKTLETKALWPARRVASGFVRFSGDEARETARLLAYVLARRILFHRDTDPDGTGLAEARTWLTTDLEPGHETALLTALTLLDHPDDPAWQDPDEDLLAALIWLTTALTATQGDNNPQWLRQFDSPPPPRAEPYATGA
ncbi:hypothetical protein LO772_12300 [Yinghuangia sp. ASG 101]|uniref:hypothetical protein n=1 Tax=Yinghuangia sp. ASG 101 TaxID=2896848 RepID=UPI001E4623F3|nr:hypothetical protein [Yinghuangia sp. ASG 101]UGQ14296.1 hypothetical protein LO772_12300 [Yinghuangia sp. ASG 101]